MHNIQTFIGLSLLAAFYAVYFGKMLLQRRKGIRTDQLGKSTGKTRRVERLTKLATYCVLAVEVASILLCDRLLWQMPLCVQATGVFLGLAGVVVFATAVITMRDSWRAGIAEGDERGLITAGIYRLSRNPAFLGFDCLYVGILLLFFNVTLLIFTLFAMVMLHQQILQEEQFLPTLFGDAYEQYRRQVRRYFGRRK